MTLVHRAGHAVMLRTSHGLEIMMHIGLDTVALGGRGFTPQVRTGQQVHTGEALIAFDADYIATHARSLLTEIIVTNMDRVARLTIGAGPATPKRGGSNEREGWPATPKRGGSNEREGWLVTAARDVVLSVVPLGGLAADASDPDRRPTPALSQPPPPRRRSISRRPPPARPYPVRLRGFWPILLAAIATGLVLARDRARYADTLLAGMAQPIVMLMIVAWLLAGVLSSLLAASGFVEALVWVASRAGLRGGTYVALAFIVCCLVSTSTGTSFGTILIGGPRASSSMDWSAVSACRSSRSCWSRSWRLSKPQACSPDWSGPRERKSEAREARRPGSSAW